MSVYDMQITMMDMVLAATFAFVATWRFASLRFIGVWLAVACAVLPFTNDMPVHDRPFVYVPLDVIGAVIGFWSWRRFQEFMGVVAIVFSVMACAGHFAIALDPFTWATQWHYIAYLNVLFLLSCAIFGMSGLDRLHAHLPRPRWFRDLRVPFGQRG